MARVAVVSGGSRGIGAAISKALKDHGCKVAATYAGNDEAAHKFSHETGIAVFKWDVSDYESCSAGLKKVEHEIGPIDILVNNAGITKDTPFHKMTPDKWYAVINTNLNSLFNMTRPVIEGMRERGWGRVINISSINGQKGQFGQTNYAAAKSVNVIAPGYIGTEMVRAVPEDVLKTKILPHIPVGRLGEPEEIARCVVFLASEEAGFITGSTISINGGQHMH